MPAKPLLPHRLGFALVCFCLRGAARVRRDSDAGRACSARTWRRRWRERQRPARRRLLAPAPRTAGQEGEALPAAAGRGAGGQEALQPLPAASGGESKAPAARPPRRREWSVPGRGVPCGATARKSCRGSELPLTPLSFLRPGPLARLSLSLSLGSSHGRSPVLLFVLWL